MTVLERSPRTNLRRNRERFICADDTTRLGRSRQQLLTERMASECGPMHPARYEMNGSRSDRVRLHSVMGACGLVLVYLVTPLRLGHEKSVNDINTKQDTI